MAATKFPDPIQAIREAQDFVAALDSCGDPTNENTDQYVAPKLARDRLEACFVKAMKMVRTIAALDSLQSRPAQSSPVLYTDGEMSREIEEQPTLSERLADYTIGSWFQANNVDEMQAFYLSRLDAIRDAAKHHGYAIGVHGSTRRDFDLIAMPWREDYSTKDELAKAIQRAACGLIKGQYEWEQKPAGRYATSFPICWTEWTGMVSAGHIDLSVLDQRAQAGGDALKLFDGCQTRSYHSYETDKTKEYYEIDLRMTGEEHRRFRRSLQPRAPDGGENPQVVTSASGGNPQAIVPPYAVASQNQPDPRDKESCPPGVRDECPKCGLRVDAENCQGTDCPMIDRDGAEGKT